MKKLLFFSCVPFPKAYAECDSIFQFLASQADCVMIFDIYKRKGWGNLIMASSLKSTWQTFLVSRIWCRQSFWICRSSGKVISLPSYKPTLNWSPSTMNKYHICKTGQIQKKEHETWKPTKTQIQKWLVKNKSQEALPHQTVFRSHTVKQLDHSHSCIKENPNQRERIKSRKTCSDPRTWKDHI